MNTNRRCTPWVRRVCSNNSAKTFAKTSLLSFALSLTIPTFANALDNAGFENGFNGWNDKDPSSVSGLANSGSRSAKISGTGGRFDQVVSLQANTQYRLTAYIRGRGRVGVEVGGTQYSERTTSNSWERVTVDFNSGGSSSGKVYGQYSGGEGRFDDFSLEVIGQQAPQSGCSSVSELNIVAATDDGTNDGNRPANAIDGDLASRWSSNGNGKWIQFDLGSVATVNSLRLAWYRGNQRNAFFSVDTSTDGFSWTSVLANAQSSGTTLALESHTVSESSARYVRVIGHGNSSSSWNSILEAEVYGCGGSTPPTPTSTPVATPVPTPTATPPPSGGLNPSLPPSGNFNLSQWNINVPIDRDGNGRSDNISENDLNDGYEHPEFFYTAADGGMVFRCPVDGFKTSTNTSYTRSELREMLRAGDTRISTRGVNKNNWVFSSAPSSAQANAGGVDGNLRATLAVNHVTTTGSSGQVGRVIIGQIHANDDEPIRLYYRKLPGNSKGSIYFAHEPRGGSDVYVEMIGRRSSSASNPSDGIALNERFSYEIEVRGDNLKVTISRPGKADVVDTFDMRNSGYDSSSQFQYFKAGVYNQNNTGDADDYVQATFYALEQTHN